MQIERCTKRSKLIARNPAERVCSTGIRDPGGLARRAGRTDPDEGGGVPQPCHASNETVERVLKIRLRLFRPDHLNDRIVRRDARKRSCLSSLGGRGENRSGSLERLLARS